jgi:hypothetical protein
MPTDLAEAVEEEEMVVFICACAIGKIIKWTIFL